MKINLKKLTSKLLVSTMIFTIGVAVADNVIIGGSKVYATGTVGQPLYSPDSGWKRYNDLSSEFMYSSGVGNLTLNNQALNNEVKAIPYNNSVSFQFYGSAFRVIGINDPTNQSAKISVKIDGVDDSTFSQRISPWNNYILNYQKTGLSKGLHTVVMTNLDNVSKPNASFIFDALDTDGYLIAKQTSNQATQVIGTFNATTLNVNIPVTSSFIYDANTGIMTAQTMNIKNLSSAPVAMNVKSIGIAPTSTWTPSLIAPTTYTDAQWNNLSKSQTNANVSLGITATDNGNFLNGIARNNFWSTDLTNGSIEIGAIKSNQDVNVQPTLKAGTAIDSQSILTSNYIFEFGLEQGIMLNTAPTGMQGYQVPKGTTGPTEMIDGNLSTNWNSGGYTGIAQINFPTSQSISAIQLAVGASPTTNEDYTIMGLQNGTWKQIGSSTQLVTEGKVNILSPISVTPGHYDAIKISVNGRGSWVCIVELTLIP